MQISPPFEKFELCQFRAIIGCANQYLTRNQVHGSSHDRSAINKNGGSQREKRDATILCERRSDKFCGRGGQKGRSVGEDMATFSLLSSFNSRNFLIYVWHEHEWILPVKVPAALLEAENSARRSKLDEGRWEGEGEEK